jgi:hypothetical protein
MPGSEYYDNDFAYRASINETPKVKNKYIRQCKGVDIDVYDVLIAFDVKCPAMQHAIKKMLCSGLRGYKDQTQDKLEAIASINRSIELGG